MIKSIIAAIVIVQAIAIVNVANANALSDEYAIDGIALTCAMHNITYEGAVEQGIFTPAVKEAIRRIGKSRAAQACNNPESASAVVRSVNSKPVKTWRATDQNGFIRIEGIANSSGGYINSAIDCNGKFAGTSTGRIERGGTFYMDFFNTPSSCSEVTFHSISID